MEKRRLYSIVSDDNNESSHSNFIIFLSLPTVIFSTNIAAVIASIVSLGSIIVFCAWCYKCWKGSEDEKDGSTESDYDSSSDSQLYGVPGHKYRAFARYSSLPDVSPSEKRVESPGYQQKSLKFSQPPPQEYDVQAPQPDVSSIVIPPEPPLIETSSKEDLGKIYFSISYDSGEMVLSLKILKATGLPAKDFSGTSDPFVKILLLPDKKHKMETRIKRKNLNPTWNEVFRFEGFAHNKLLSRTLYLQVLDYDRFSRNDPIGEIEIPLCDVDLGPTTLTFCKDLQPCKRQVCLIVCCDPYTKPYFARIFENIFVP